MVRVVELNRDRERQEAVRTWIESGTPFGGKPPESIATHGNLLFLTPRRVYKMKRVINFGWMDFSSLEKRAEACRQELLLNRRTAPALYLQVLAVTQDAKGFALAGSGEAVEWLVEMQRFEESLRLDHLSDRGELTARHARDLADDVAAFHRRAEPAERRDFATILDQVARENDGDMGKAAGLFPESQRDELRSLSLAEVARHRSLIADRVAAGWLRRCHGDLHLANIVLWQDRPTPFDCIEFNEDYISIDLLYDLAFLLMDLEQRGRSALANLLLNRWLAMAPGPEQQLRGLALLPLLLSLRAGVRAKIAGLQWLETSGRRRQELAEAAQLYLQRARSYLQPSPPELVAVGGLSGSGKSTLAAGLAPGLGAAPGAILLRSDVVRKRLNGVAPESHLPAEAYSEAENRRIAATLLRYAAAALGAGRSVILDAVSADPEFRQPLRDLASRLSSRFSGLWLEAPLETLKARVAARQSDASDATPAVVERQAEGFTPPESWRRLDAQGTAEVTLALAQVLLGRP